jgi:hypothetical protein
VAGNTWDDVDFPVLRWVFEASRVEEAESGDLGHDSDELSVVAGVSKRDLHAGLSRLHDYGLVEGINDATFAFQFWVRLRPTAQGLRVLGEWPPASAAEMNDAVVLMLRELAEQSDDPDEQKVYRRAAGAVGKFGASVVLETAKGELRRLGGDVAE